MTNIKNLNSDQTFIMTKPKNSYSHQTQNVTRLENFNCDKTQKLKLKKKLKIFLFGRNWKLKFDSTQKLQLWQNSKTLFGTKPKTQMWQNSKLKFSRKSKNSKEIFIKTQKSKLWKKMISYILTKLKFWQTQTLKNLSPKTLIIKKNIFWYNSN